MCLDIDRDACLAWNDKLKNGHREFYKVLVYFCRGNLIYLVSPLIQFRSGYLAPQYNFNTDDWVYCHADLAKCPQEIFDAVLPYVNRWLPGEFVSDRKRKRTRGASSVLKGVHVHCWVPAKSLITSFHREDALCGEIVVTVTAKQEDFIASGYGDAAFMRVNFPKSSYDFAIKTIREFHNLKEE